MIALSTVSQGRACRVLPQGRFSIDLQFRNKGSLSCPVFGHCFLCDCNLWWCLWLQCRLSAKHSPFLTLRHSPCGHAAVGVMPKSCLWYHILSIMTCLLDGSEDTGIDKSKRTRDSSCEAAGGRKIWCWNNLAVDLVQWFSTRWFYPPRDVWLKTFLSVTAGQSG